MAEITTAQAKQMQKLAQEGKGISKIVSEDYPEFDYSDVYVTVYSGGQKSAQGAKKTITNRINALAESGSKKERNALAEELHELVQHLYNNHKKNQGKLEMIRKALDS
jgi:hypothetical protein